MKDTSRQDPGTRPQQRVLQYQHIDGTYELTFGGAFLLMGIGFFILSRISFPDSFVSRNILPFAPLVAFTVGAILIDYAIKRFRARVTYPRSGYITYKKPQPLKRPMRLFIWIGIPVLVVVLDYLLFLNRSKFPTPNQDYFSFLMLGFSAVLFSGLWAIIGWKVALPRFYLIAIITFLTGTGLFINGIGGYTGWALLLGITGTALLISGGITLGKYLRQNPEPKETPNEQ
jgi:hypothetical protein